METRKIKFPAPLIITSPNGDAVTYAFPAFVAWMVDNDTKYAKSVSLIASAARIIDAFVTAKEVQEGEAPEGTDPVMVLQAELAVADWQLLRDTVSNPPEGKLPLSPPRALLPFMEAIVNA